MKKFRISYRSSFLVRTFPDDSSLALFLKRNGLEGSNVELLKIIERRMVFDEAGDSVDFLDWFESVENPYIGWFSELKEENLGDQAFFDAYYKTLEKQSEAYDLKLKKERAKREEKESRQVLGRDWRETFHSVDELKCIERLGGFEGLASEASREFGSGNLTQDQIGRFFK